MKKLLLVASIAFLLAVPRVLAEERGHDLDEDHDHDDEEERCVNFHAGNDVEELHESAEAELHEHEDDVCPSGSPTATPNATPTGTGTPTGTPTATPTGTGTPTGTPTATPTGTPLTITLQGESLTGQLEALIQQLINLLRHFGERD